MIRGRLDVLDGLRGIAIALVVWYHVWQISWLSAGPFQFLPETGWLGVELFFFLSGFVIAAPYVRAHLRRSPPPGLRHFIVRRAAKIVPSYVAAIAILAAAGYARWPSLGAAAGDIAAHLAFVHIWFASMYGSIDGVMWSLGTEVQFYVIFPLLILAFVRAPWITAAAMTALALVWRLAVVPAHAFYANQMLGQLPAMLDLFAAGMLAAWVHERYPAATSARARTMWTLAALAAAALFILLAQHAFAVRYSDGEWKSWHATHRIFVALACFCFASAGLRAAPAFRAAVANPVLVFLAAISYNLYLWHQVIARVAAGWSWLPHTGTDLHTDPQRQIAYTVVTLAAALAVATAFTFALERPLLRLTRAKPAQVPVADGDAGGVEPLHEGDRVLA